MQQKCTYIPDVDRTPVVPDQAISLGLALSLGRVPANLGPSEALFNGIENPANIVGRPRDEFDAMMVEGTLRESSAAPAAAPATSQE